MSNRGCGIRVAKKLWPDGTWLGGAVALALFGMLSLPLALGAAPPVTPQMVDISSAAPRAVEETTVASIQRDYAHGWQSLVSALGDNRADLLNENFTGDARQRWQEAIHAQQQNGLNRRIVDHSHKLKVSFYSLDGSALEATDTVDMEIQYREGSKVLSSEHIEAHYMVLLTPAENSWKIRILQEIPAS